MSADLTEREQALVAALADELKIESVTADIDDIECIVSDGIFYPIPVWLSRANNSQGWRFAR
jgi:hypothetical protein